MALRFQAKRLLISVLITVCLSRHPPSNLDHLPDAVNLHALDQPMRNELAALHEQPGFGGQRLEDKSTVHVCFCGRSDKFSLAARSLDDRPFRCDG